MRHAPRQDADRFHLLRLAELVFDTASLGDVLKRGRQVARVAFRVRQFLAIERRETMSNAERRCRIITERRKGARRDARQPRPRVGDTARAHFSRMTRLDSARAAACSHLMRRQSSSRESPHIDPHMPARRPSPISACRGRPRVMLPALGAASTDVADEPFLAAAKRLLRRLDRGDVDAQARRARPLGRRSLA